MVVLEPQSVETHYLFMVIQWRGPIDPHGRQYGTRTSSSS